MTGSKDTPRFALGNDAMQGPQDVADALRRIADDIEIGAPGFDVWHASTEAPRNIRDENGNTVGSWMVEER